jgi:hypothetical protein
MYSVKVYRGTSIRTKNGGEADLPTFGEFSCKVEESEYDVAYDEYEKVYFVFLPFCSIAGDFDEEQEAIDYIQNSLKHGPWVTDRDQAVQDAIARAKARSEEKEAERNLLPDCETANNELHKSGILPGDMAISERVWKRNWTRNRIYKALKGDKQCIGLMKRDAYKLEENADAESAQD